MTAHAATRLRLLGLTLAALSGVGSALQARVNGELAVRLGDGIAAALLSFGVGLALVGAATFSSPRGRAGLRRVRAALRPPRPHPPSPAPPRLRWWHCLGGLGGAAFVAGQSLTAAVLGVAVFTVAVVGGQALSGLAADRFGWGPAGRVPVTRWRLGGALLTVIAIAVAGGRPAGDGPLLLALLPAAAGLAVGWQAAVNGRVRQAAGGALPATLLNFSVGTAALTLLFGVDVAARGLPAALPTEPWLYSGGVLGVAFITVAAATVRFTGVLLLGLATIAGQVAGSVLLDLTLPGAAGTPGPRTYLAAALAFAGALTAAVRGTAPAVAGGGREPVRPHTAR
ncbi:MAG TPA: DMT family transporter [Pilimelia sp.]|nr:DMT family transporter [Pilimelia sp.]